MFSIRVADIVLSAIAITVFLPFYFIILFILLFDDSGPIFFSQKRVTKNEKLFKFVKFRSMIYSPSANRGDSEEYLTMDLAELKKIRANYFTTKSSDSRVTKLGKVLRKTSLDETPQLFSVLKGDMSMVGPRPDPPIQKADYDPVIWAKRCEVKSGITGLAQVNGRSLGGVQKRIEYDIYWADNKSFWLYCKILIKTPFVLMKNSY